MKLKFKVRSRESFLVLRPDESIPEDLLGVTVPAVEGRVGVPEPLPGVFSLMVAVSTVLVRLKLDPPLWPP